MVVLDIVHDLVVLVSLEVHDLVGVVPVEVHVLMGLVPDQVHYLVGWSLSISLTWWVWS